MSAVRARGFGLATAGRWSGLLAGLAALTVLSVLQDRPSFDPAGRTIVYVCGDRLGLTAVWPPTGYPIPVLTLVLIGLAAALGALHLLVRRPRPAGIDVADDDRARRDAAATAVGCWALGGLLVPRSRSRS